MRAKANGGGWAITVGLLAASAAATRGDVWVTGPSHRVLRSEKATACAIFDAEKGTVVLHAARNEFAAFQIVYDGPLQAVNVAPAALRGPGGRALNIAFYREHFLPAPVLSQCDANTRPADCVALDARCKALGAPREFPEIMVPLDAKKHGAPFDVAAGGNEVVWGEVFVPEDAAPGLYQGEIATAGRALKVRLTVWNFTLPSVSHFPHWAYIGPEEIAWGFRRPPSEIPRMQAAFDAYFQMAHDHRLTLAEGFCYDEDYIRGADRKYLDHYTGAAFKGPFAAGFGFELLPVEPQFAALVERQRWLNRAFVYLADEPGDKEAFQHVLDRGREVREKTGGRLRRMVTKDDVPPDPGWPDLSAETDIFCSAAVPPSRIPELEKRGKAVWTYNGGYAGGPYVDAPGQAARTHAWAGFLTGARAWFFWDAGYVVDKQNRWRDERRNINADPARYLTDVWRDALTFDETAKPWKGGRYPAAWAIRLNGDGLLIYPGLEAGVDGPLASLRLKNIREGAQDFEYLYLLEKTGHREEALKEARALLGNCKGNHFDYELDAGKWDAARLRLGAMLDRVGEAAIRARVVPWNEYPNPVGHPGFHGGARY
jgi:hypothetical protein